MDDYFGFNNPERDAPFAKSAAKSPPGLPREHLTPGALVTISPDKCNGDRSYSHDVWEILAVNELHVCIIRKTDGSSFFRGPHQLIFHDFEFYGAEHFSTAQATEA